MQENKIWEIYSKEKTLDATIYNTIYEVKNKQTGKLYIANDLLKEKCNINFIKKIKSIQSDNIISIKEIFESKEKIYIITDFYQYNLQQYLKMKGKLLSINEIKEIFLQINNCMKMMIEKEIIHGNINLSNILISLNQNKQTIVKLSYLDSIFIYNIEDTMLITSKNPLLTEAPEILNANPFSNKSDLWSLGIILYYLCFQEFPFKGKNEFSLLQNIKSNINNIKKVNDNKLNALIKKMLIINPDERIAFNEYYNDSFFQNNNLNYIICEYLIKQKKENNQILNSYEEVKRKNPYRDWKNIKAIENEKEIKENCEIYLNNKRIDFCYEYKFEKEDKNEIKIILIYNNSVY